MNTIKKFYALAAITMLLPGVVKSQEKTIEVQNLDDVTSIVRECRDGDWMVCNNSNGRTRFTKVNEYGSTADQLWLGYTVDSDSMRVNDFEIFRDTVYFCGQIWYWGYSYAVWGYFPVSGFPSLTVRYHEHDYIRSFKKMDVFSADTATVDLHVVLLADMEEEDMSDLVVDEVRTAPHTFNQNESPVFESQENYRFYDVEITDMHVAISTSMNSGSVLFIDKPTTLSTSIFTSNAVNNPLYTLPCTGPIPLEYCKNDILVAAFRTLFDQNLHVESFSLAVPQYHLSIDETTLMYPVDLKFNRQKDALELLANPYGNNTFSVIYHLNHSLTANGGPLFCHMFKPESLNSLEWLSSKDVFFVASGHDAGQQHLHLYKYRYDDWGECTEQLIANARKLSVLKSPTTPPVVFYQTKIETDVLESFDLDNPLKIKCGK